MEILNSYSVGEGDREIMPFRFSSFFGLSRNPWLSSSRRRRRPEAEHGGNASVDVVHVVTEVTIVTEVFLTNEVDGLKIEDCDTSLL